MTLNMLDHALAYAAKGYFIFPCECRGKKPLTSNGHKDATTDERIIRQWWTKWPDANIGLALEPSGLLAIDMDRHEGKPDGVKAYNKLRGENKFPDKTPVSISGGNGYHIIVKRPAGKLKAKVVPGIDVKSNGYIILPPSIHPSGKLYKWQDGLSLLDVQPVDPPEWLLHLILKEEKSSQTKPEAILPNNYPASSGEVVIQRCAFMRHVAEDAASLAEVDWYQGIGVLAYAIEGSEIVHQYSRSHPGYSLRDTEAKLLHWKQDGQGPPTCQTIQDKCGEDYCKQCPYNGKIKSPIVLGYASRSTQKPLTRMPFPVEVLPGVFQQFAFSTAEALQCPVDYIGCSLLAVVSILMGSNWQIQLAPEWCQFANLWIALVGTPSSKKSPALEKSFAVLRKIEKELHIIYQRDLGLYEMALRQHELELKTWKSDPSGEPPIKPKKPVRQRITTSDTTAEALGELLACSLHGIALVCDELSSWMRSMNQYKGGRGADRSHYLEMWSNAQMTIDRKEKEPIVVTSPYLTLIGGIQPDLLLEMSNQGTEDGMKERLLFSCPLPNKEPPTSGIKIPLEIHTAMAVCLRKTFQERPAQLVTIGLSEGAQQVFLEARREWHRITNAEGFQSEREAYYAKMGNYIGRLALVLHEMKRANGESDSNEVAEETMQQAKSLTDYFLSHAHVALGMVMQTREEQQVEKIAQWIQKRDLTVVSPRDLTTNKVAGCCKASQAKAMLQTLHDYGFGYWNGETGRLIFFRDAVSNSA